jgi:predicted DNA-binding transcriptional regulator AlpA
MAQVQQVNSFDELPAALSVWPGLGQALGISRATAYKLIKEPGFPCLRIAQRKIVIPKDRLIKYIEQKAEAGLS